MGGVGQTPSIPGFPSLLGPVPSSLQGQRGQRPHTQASILSLSLSLQTLPPAQENGTHGIPEWPEIVRMLYPTPFPPLQLKTKNFLLLSAQRQTVEGWLPGPGGVG